MDWLEHENAQVAKDVENLRTFFRFVNERPDMTADAAQGIIQNSLDNLDSAGAEVAKNLDEILGSAGMTRRDLVSVFIRGKNIAVGETLETPYMGAHVVTEADLAPTAA